MFKKSIFFLTRPTSTVYGQARESTHHAAGFSFYSDIARACSPMRSHGKGKPFLYLNLMLVGRGGGGAMVMAVKDPNTRSRWVLPAAIAVRQWLHPGVRLCSMEWKTAIANG
jgi:hypothetical protein